MSIKPVICSFDIISHIFLEYVYVIISVIAASEGLFFDEFSSKV